MIYRRYKMMLKEMILLALSHCLEYVWPVAVDQLGIVQCHSSTHQFLLLHSMDSYDWNNWWCR